MTASDFVRWATDYYGPWPEGLRADVAEYLAEKDPRYLDELKRVCLETVPTRYGQVNGYPPDVAGLIALSETTGARIDAADRSRRELALQSRLLPAPASEPVGSEDLIRLDWVKVFEHGQAARKRAEEKNRS